MRILTIDCDASTLDFRLVAVRAPGTSEEATQPIAGGLVQGVSGPAWLTFAATEGGAVRQTEWIDTHGDAVRRVLAWLGSVIPLASIAAVGYRMASETRRAHPSGARSDRRTTGCSASRQVSQPLGESLEAIKELLGSNVPLVGVSEAANLAALPARATSDRGPGPVRGLAHRAMAAAYPRLVEGAPVEARLITVDLCSASSVAAQRGGRPIDGLRSADPRGRGGPRR